MVFKKQSIFKINIALICILTAEFITARNSKIMHQLPVYMYNITHLSLRARQKIEVFISMCV